jgi:hypothetical protein
MKKLLIALIILTLVGCNTGNGNVPPEDPNTGNENPGTNGSDTGNDNDYDDNTDKETSENGISGVWMGFVVPYWQYTPVERYLTIYEDGTLFHDLPLAGLDGFDPEKSKTNENEQGYWGTYSLDGTSGTYIYNQSSQPWEMSIEADGTLKLGVDTYYRTNSVDGLRLDGSWSTSPDAEFAEQEIDGLKYIIRFTPDGRFQDEGLMWGFFDFRDPEASSVGPGKGTYEIINYTLHLSYDDGRTRSAAFSLFLSGEQEPSPSMIYIHRTGLYSLDN